MNALTDFSLRRPALCLALTALATLALGSGTLRLETDAGYRAFLGDQHPAIQAIDAFAERFGGGLPFAAVWSCAESSGCESVFDGASLAMAHTVARALEAVPGVRRVDSPATSPLLYHPEIGLPEARRLAPHGVPASDLDALIPWALADPSWAQRLISPDARAGALVVHLGDSRSSAGVRAVHALDAALAPFEAQGFVFARVGGPVEFVVAGEELARGAARLVPLMVGLVALALVALFRAPAPAALALLASGLAVLWTLGLQGWLGWPQNSLTEVLPPLVLVIGVCDAVHLLARAATRARGVATNADALRAAVSEVGGACALTTLTTAAGLASFSAGGLESLARFGLLGAFGSLAALLLTFSLLPVLALRVPPRWLASRPAGSGRGLAAIERAVRGAPRLWLALAALLALVAALGATRLEVDARFEDLYGENSQVVRWARAAARHLREAETLEIAIALPAGTSIASPEALAVVERVEGLSRFAGIGHPLSLRVQLDRLHRELHGAPLPTLPGVRTEEPRGVQSKDAHFEEARALAEKRSGQMLRLLGREEPELVALFASGTDRTHPGDGHASALRVSFLADKLPQRQLRALLARVHLELEQILPPGYAAVVTGPLATVAAMIDELRSTQLRSFAVAALLVFALVSLYFRSLALGALAMLPTLLPVLWTLGSMGALGIPLDIGSAMVAAVVLGLAIDDAIHFLSAWQRRRRAGAARGDAALEALRDVGRALVITSLALAAGFTALALAPWQSIASFGAVAAVAILAALAAVLLVLPSLLVASDPARRRAAGAKAPGPAANARAD